MRSRARAIFDRVSTIACGGEKKWRVAPQRIAWTSHQIISDLMERPCDIIVHRYIQNELIFLGRREDGVWGWRSREKRENCKKEIKEVLVLPGRALPVVHVMYISNTHILTSKLAEENFARPKNVQNVPK